MSTTQNIAFVAPRFMEGPTIGGAETLLKQLAIHLTKAGHKVSFLTTCARNHFTWENEVPAGTREIDGLQVHFFPVDENRDIEIFHRIQQAICNGHQVTKEEETLWLKNNVNSTPLYQHLKDKGEKYDHILMGPYLFGLTHAAAAIHPDKTMLVPCLHDEAFAYLKSIAEMFKQVKGCIFNATAEKELAKRLYNLDENKLYIVGMGLDTFEYDNTKTAQAHNIPAPYLLYCGRREGLKGTPLLIDYFTAFRKRTGKDIYLVFTGTGVIDIPTDMKTYVIDLGFVTEEEKHNAMAGALVFCHPSLNESFGIVLLEAWLASTPALVHTGSAVLSQHCADSKAGLWFNSYPEFEAELLLLLENKELCTAMGKAGKEYVEKNYSWQSIEEKLKKALK
jgi:glycosyltransferase involved in cell wall biosynthesis